MLMNTSTIVIKNDWFKISTCFV